MNGASAKRADIVQANGTLIRVRADAGTVRLQANVQEPGCLLERTLVFPPLQPAESLMLAHTLSSAANEAAQQASPRRERPAIVPGARHSAAAIAEMRRLRAGGYKLQAIADRFRCPVEAVSRHTAGIIDPATNHWRRRPVGVLAGILRMHGEGATVRQIAAHFACSESGVRAVINRYREASPGYTLAPVTAMVHQLPIPFRFGFVNGCGAEE